MEKICLVGLLLACMVIGVNAEEFDARTSNIIVPQSRAIRVRPEVPRADITGVTAKVRINELAATTVLEIGLKNDSDQMIEAQMMVPVPPGAAVTGLAYGEGKDTLVADILPLDEARRIYNTIVSQMKDPALAEFAGYSLIKTSVFPVPPRGTQMVRLTYENILQVSENRVDYMLPRSEMISSNIPWNISAEITSFDGITGVYSTSHGINVTFDNETKARAELSSTAATVPGNFRLSYIRGNSSLDATLMAYPDEDGDGGYFVYILAAPPSDDEEKTEILREVTISIDRSGSMRGVKMDQAKAAAIKAIEGLRDGEAFNIIDYAGDIAQFAKQPVIKDAATLQAARGYIEAMRASGGTALHGALVRCLEQEPTEGMLPLVIFLTDGQPTVGVRDEATIRQDAISANKHNRRIFSFGVGYDVNAPLLDHLASNSRATSTYVLPQEDVAEKVTQLFHQLTGPVLANLNLAITGAGGDKRVRDILPSKLGDLYEAGTLVVVGRYSGTQPLSFALTGTANGAEKTLEHTFHLTSHADSANSFIARLWAQRQISSLIDTIRQMGASGRPNMNDPAVKELIEEIVKLSTQFGILTEYTAFLAREDVVLSAPAPMMMEQAGAAMDMVVSERKGQEAVRQAMNIAADSEDAAPRPNVYIGRDMKQVEIRGVQQAGGRAFFRRGGQWVDSRVAARKEEVKPDDIVLIGSAEHGKLLDRLSTQNSQSILAMEGEILLELDGRVVLVREAEE